MNKLIGIGTKNKIMTLGIIGLMLALASGITMASSVGVNLNTSTNGNVNQNSNANLGVGFRTWMGSWFHSSNSVNPNWYNNSGKAGFFAHMGTAWSHFAASMKAGLHI